MFVQFQMYTAIDVSIIFGTFILSQFTCFCNIIFTFNGAVLYTNSVLPHVMVCTLFIYPYFLLVLYALFWSLFRLLSPLFVLLPKIVFFTK